MALVYIFRDEPIYKSIDYELAEREREAQEVIGLNDLESRINERFKNERKTAKYSV